MAETKTIKKEKAEETPKRNINVTRAADYGIIYSDTVRMASSAYDIKVTFGINEVLPDNNVLITEMVTVALTPQHAKDLAKTLAENIARYEQDIMPLNISEKHKLEQKKLIQKLLPAGE